MLRTDVNCLIGHWPYRKLYKNTFDDLKKIHMDNNISSGYVSSLDSIFYNDPFEGDEELHEIIKGSAYHHVLTINPVLPEFQKDIERGINLFDIKGVKIYPGYHGYNLNDSLVDSVCTVLKKYDLPLFVVLRMEDERLNHIVKTRNLQQDEISKFICRNKDNRIVFLNANFYEILNLKDDLKTNENVYFDTCGLKGTLFSMENLIKQFDVNKILFGSLHPLYCFTSTLFLVEKAKIDEKYKEKILCENVNQLYK